MQSFTITAVVQVDDEFVEAEGGDEEAAKILKEQVVASLIRLQIVGAVSVDARPFAKMFPIQEGP